MRRSFAFLVAILAAATTFAAAPPNPPFRHQMTATVEETPLPDGAFARKIVQPRFEFFTLWPDTGAPGDPEEVFLEQVFTISYQTNSEGMPSMLTATAWKTGRPGGKNRYDTRLWTITDDANEADMLRYGELYRTTQYGCCASENVQRIYDVRNGKLAAVSTIQPGIVEVPNTPVRRIVAYHSTAGVVSPPEAEKMSRLMGVLTLSARSEVLHRVAMMDAGTDEERDRPPVSPVNDQIPSDRPEENPSVGQVLAGVTKIRHLHQLADGFLHLSQPPVRRVDIVASDVFPGFVEIPARLRREDEKAHRAARRLWLFSHKPWKTSSPGIPSPRSS
jgi:hypothetical protein